MKRIESLSDAPSSLRVVASDFVFNNKIFELMEGRRNSNLGDLNFLDRLHNSSALKKLQHESSGMDHVRQIADQSGGIVSPIQRRVSTFWTYFLKYQSPKRLGEIMVFSGGYSG